MLWLQPASLLVDWKKDRRKVAVMTLSSFPVPLEEYCHHILQKTSQSVIFNRNSFPPDSRLVGELGLNNTYVTEQERDLQWAQRPVPRKCQGESLNRGTFAPNP